MDLGKLRSLGKVIEDEDDHDFVLYAGNHAAIVKIQGHLDSNPPHSVVVTGHSGVGKYAAIRIALDTLIMDGWVVLVASSTDIASDTKFVGELEQAVLTLGAHASVKNKVVWYCPDLLASLTAGAGMNAPERTVFNLVLPYLVSGEVCMVSDVDQKAWSDVLRLRPNLRSVFRSISLDEPTVDQCVDLIESVQLHANSTAVDRDMARLITLSALQFLSYRKLPGSAMQILDDILDTLKRPGRREKRVRREDVYKSLTDMTGLPELFLNDAKRLDIAELKQVFNNRIKGQPSAVDSIIERLAMMKAGLTDPDRPIGVLLFAGPTGTGKTEVAKVLGEYLFGTADRVIRIDMSELVGHQGLARIIGSADSSMPVDSLVQQVSAQPFSVVLLDEIEKSVPAVWDLFLQVFDDGRLSGVNGNVADFRHTIIIMTSNAGVSTHQRRSPGFTSGEDQFGELHVREALKEVFRPEFINRFDRVVVFRPLSRSAMREILVKDLSRTLQRRGFRDRPWAIEFEDSAVNFLLEHGFTTDMGARPLRRAIEQHVLAPMALTIASGKFPDGDQFLFIRSNGRRITAEFVDLEADSGWVTVPTEQAFGSTDLREILRSARGDASEASYLVQQFDAISKKLDLTGLQEQKAELLSETEDPDFWDSARRVTVWDMIAQLDRIEAGFQSAESVAQRVRARLPKGASGRALVESLATQLYVLKAGLEDLRAGVDQHVWLIIDSLPREGGNQRRSDWPEQLARMYERWAMKRNITAKRVFFDQGNGQGNGNSSQPIGLAFSGLGVHQFLKGESGLHILEVSDGDRKPDRSAAWVSFLTEPESFSSRRAGTESGRTTRRYSSVGSPLVRDHRGWSTGRLDAVLDGNFDLYGER